MLPSVALIVLGNMKTINETEEYTDTIEVIEHGDGTETVNAQRVYK
jgi:hypothetical protein